MGVERRTMRGIEKDYIHLEYANKEKLFVPIEQMNLVQRYIGQSAEQVQLDNLGTAWVAKKEENGTKKDRGYVSRITRIICKTE